MSRSIEYAGVPLDGSASTTRALARMLAEKAQALEAMLPSSRREDSDRPPPDDDDGRRSEPVSDE